MLDLVLVLPHDHHLAEDPHQCALRLHLPEVHTHCLGPGEGRRAGAAAAGDRQCGDGSIRSPLIISTWTVYQYCG